MLVFKIIREIFRMGYRSWVLSKEIKRLQNKVSIAYGLSSRKELLNLPKQKEIRWRNIRVIFQQDRLKMDEKLFYLNSDLASQFQPMVKNILKKVETESKKGILLKTRLIQRCRHIEQVIQKLQKSMDENQRGVTT